MRSLLPLLLSGLAVCSAQTLQSRHAAIETLVSGVSQDRISATIQKLVSFDTRDTNGLIEAPGKGIGAARQWLFDEFKRQSPKLNVHMDPHPIKKGNRVVHDMELVNVVAELKGSVHPEQVIVIGAHYDSMHMVTLADTTPVKLDAEATAHKPIAPGAADNASGVAALMELARLMSDVPVTKTVVFVAFAGEEQGLLGARAYAEQAAAQKQQIEAMLNMDVIGTEVNGAGIHAGRKVNLYSGDPQDSSSRALARAIKETAERYLPGYTVNTVFRQDRFGRGGDHTPFFEEGFAAVRFTTPAEQLENQHTPNDTFDHVSVPYTAEVTQAVGAALAHLAMSPSAPKVKPLGRGKNRYDADLKWEAKLEDPQLAGFEILIRSTTAAFWERSIYVGKVDQVLLPQMPVDEVVLGVRAIGTGGLASPVSAWALPPRSPFSTRPAEPAKPATSETKPADPAKSGD